MKKLITTIVLCAASMAIAQIDYDLTATFNAAGEIILTNTGDDVIGIATFGFLDPTWASMTTIFRGMSSSVFPLPFVFFGPLVETAEDVTVTNLNFTHQLEAAGTRNLGVINSLNDMNQYAWEQSFTAEGDEVAYLFTLVEVPEPASMSLLALGGLTILRRRR